MTYINLNVNINVMRTIGILLFEYFFKGGNDRMDKIKEYTEILFEDIKYIDKKSSSRKCL